jgi:hypothetical protein
LRPILVVIATSGKLCHSFAERLTFFVTRLPNDLQFFKKIRFFLGSDASF